MENIEQLLKPMDDGSEFSLVELKDVAGRLYPYCKKHGAMNKITAGDQGVWRCISNHSRTKVINGNSISYKQNDNTCRAAAIQNGLLPNTINT